MEGKQTRLLSAAWNGKKKRLVHGGLFIPCLEPTAMEGKKEKGTHSGWPEGKA